MKKLWSIICWLNLIMIWVCIGGNIYWAHVLSRANTALGESTIRLNNLQGVVVRDRQTIEELRQELAKVTEERDAAIAKLERINNQ